MIRKILVLLAVTAAVGLVLQLQAAPRVFKVTGVVRAPLEGSRIVVAHDEIVGFMPAMTMGFRVAESARAEAAQLRAGDRVEFTWSVDEEGSEATKFRVIGKAAAAPAPSGSAKASAASIPRVREGDSVPEFELVDETGRPLTRRSLDGHLTLMTFIFTRCPVPEYCPLIARRFGEIQRAITADPKLSSGVKLLSVSLDPQFDRPEVLKAYGAAVGADPEFWQFATGDDAEVARLVKAFSVYTERNGVTLDHTLCTALIDRSGKVVELWRGNGWKTEDVLEALKTAAAAR